jgi:hypothetical protein
MQTSGIRRTATLCLMAALTWPHMATARQDSQPESVPEGFEDVLAEPPSSLAPMPKVLLDQLAHRATAEEIERARQLIRGLAAIDTPDFGMAPWMSGHQFAPVAASQEFQGGIIMMDHGLKTDPALKALVEMGPKAMRALLDSLGDSTPTKLVFEHGGGMGAMWYGREVPSNAANPREIEVRRMMGDRWRRNPSFGSFDAHIKSHTMTVGDVCFVALGQIVNRGYAASRYQPTACRVINSPTQDPVIAEIVREIWSSDEPAQRLSDSLLADFCTRGGDAAYQIGAAMRLLYYFPDETASLLVNRLDDLNARHIRQDGDDAAWQAQYNANGFWSIGDLIEALAWSGHQEVNGAILRILERTDEPQVFAAGLTQQVVALAPERVLEHAARIVATPPPSEQGPFGGEHHLLTRMAHLEPDRSRPLFETYLAHGTLQCRRAVIHALTKPAKPVPWAVSVLRPLLDDATDTGWQYGPEYHRKPIRVCDEAAMAMVAHVPGFEFEYAGDTAHLDRRIDALKRHLAGEPLVIERAAATELADLSTVPQVPEVWSMTVPTSCGRIYAFSTRRQIFAGTGYRAHCWAYDTVSMSLGEGITSRTKLDEWDGGVSIIGPVLGEKAFCYHGYDGGRIVVRSLRTGEPLVEIDTPFHDGVSFDDPLQIRGLNDIAVSRDEKWILALTPDGSLHAIDVGTGGAEVVWKREGEATLGHLMGSLIPMAGTNRFLIEFFGEEDSLRIWDQDALTMTSLENVPRGAWRDAWGRYALNHLNNHLVLWDLEQRKPLRLPFPDGTTIHALECSPDGRLAAVVIDGRTVLLSLPDLTPVVQIPVAVTGRVSVSFIEKGNAVAIADNLSTRSPESGEVLNEGMAITVGTLNPFKP